MRIYPFAAPGAWDKFGMTASTLCVIHCVAMPFVIGFLPALGLEFLAHERIHHVLAFIVVGVAALAFMPGYRKHGKKYVLLLMGVGLTSLLFAAFEAEALLGAWAEPAFTVLGGTLLVTAHWLNRSFCRLCSVCQGEPACCDAD